MEAHQQRRRRSLQEKEPRHRAGHRLILPAIPDGKGDFDGDFDVEKRQRYRS